MPAYDIPVLRKQPADNRLYDMQFLSRMDAGETITAVLSCTATPSGLDLGTASFSGTLAQVRIGSGVSGVKYKVTFVVSTSADNTLEGEGYLAVRNA
jgi:hypothetical protein